MMNTTLRFNSSKGIRQLSTKINVKESLKNNKNKPPNSQPFVKVRLTPGESDPLSKLYKNRKPNPIYRPRWRNKAQIISAEDFAARPKVTFEEQFDSLHDAMLVFSWLDEDKRQDIYQSYLELMVEQDKEFKTTSHEYVMRVVAEKFNLTPSRVSAIVQNCHDEEQAAKNGDYVNDKLAAYMDEKIKEQINNIYMAYGEVNPNEYVEDPSASTHVSTNTSEIVKVEDLYDVDDLTQKAIAREKGEAQLQIDEKVYIEDVDYTTVDSKVDAECLKLIKQTNEEFKELKQIIDRNGEDETEFALPDGGPSEDEDGNIVDVQRRPRWKFVAQTINVREQKKKGKQSRSGGKLKQKDRKDNTLVEQDGLLRVATVEEVASTPWRNQSEGHEKLYSGVKAAWLNRKHKGEKGGWGRVPAAPKPKVEEKVEEETAEEIESSADTSDDGSKEGGDSQETGDDKK